MATWHGFAWSSPDDEWGRSRLEIKATLESSWFDFTPAIDIHDRGAGNEALHLPRPHDPESGFGGAGLATSMAEAPNQLPSESDFTQAESRR